MENIKRSDLLRMLKEDNGQSLGVLADDRLRGISCMLFGREIYSVYFDGARYSGIYEAIEKGGAICALYGPEGTNRKAISFKAHQETGRIVWEESTSGDRYPIVTNAIAASIGDFVALDDEVTKLFK